MRTLDRYVQQKVASRYAMLLVIFLAVVLGGQLAIFIGRGAPPEALIPIIPASLLLGLPIAVPLAVATALLVSIGAMAREGEFQALSAAGIDPKRVILRMWPFVLRSALLVALLAHVAMPFALRDIRANKGRILQAAIATKVASLRPIYDKSGVTAWANQVDGRQLTDVYVRRVGKDGDMAAFAPHASWELTSHGLEFRLEDVRLIEIRTDGNVVSGEAAHYVVYGDQGEGLLTTEPDGMSTLAVIDTLRGPPTGEKWRSTYNNSRLTLHLRLYMPFAIIAYALFAAGLALVFAMSESLAAIAVTVVVVAIATYPAIGFVKSNPHVAQMDPGILLWGPGLVLGLLGWWMLRRPSQVRDLAGAPLGVVRRLIRAVQAVSLRVFRKIRARRSDQ